MTSETDEQFLDRLEATPRYNPAYRTLDSDRLFDLARRGAEAAARIAQLEAEADEQVQWVKDLADLQIKAEARIGKLEAALTPLCCTCDRAASDECSRAEVDCPFWNARAALEERT